MIRLRFIVRQQVFEIVVDTIAQIRQGVADLFQNGDAGIMDIEIRPQRAGQVFKMADTFLAQEVVVEDSILRKGRHDSDL